MAMFTFNLLLNYMHKTFISEKVVLTVLLWQSRGCGDFMVVMGYKESYNLLSHFATSCDIVTWALQDEIKSFNISKLNFSMVMISKNVKSFK